MQTPEAGSAAVFIHRFDTHVPLAIERYGPDRLGEKYFRGIVTVEQAVFAAFLEFQTTVDRYMAVRLLACVSLLYQGLIRAGQLPVSGKLPPVVPGSFSFRIGVALQAPRRDKGLCSRWGFACRHPPHEPQPSPQVEPDDSTSPSAH